MLGTGDLCLAHLMVGPLKNLTREIRPADGWRPCVLLGPPPPQKLAGFLGLGKIARRLSLICDGCAVPRMPAMPMLIWIIVTKNEPAKSHQLPPRGVVTSKR